MKLISLAQHERLLLAEENDLKGECTRRAKPKLMRLAESGQRVDVSAFAKAEAEYQVAEFNIDRNKLRTIEAHLYRLLYAALAGKKNPVDHSRVYLCVDRHTFQHVESAPPEHCWKECVRIWRNHYSKGIDATHFEEWCKEKHGPMPSKTEKEIARLRDAEARINGLKRPTHNGEGQLFRA